jgi:hypothetical protein
MPKNEIHIESPFSIRIVDNSLYISWCADNPLSRASILIHPDGTYTAGRFGSTSIVGGLSELLDVLKTHWLVYKEEPSKSEKEPGK